MELASLWRTGNAKVYPRFHSCFRKQYSFVSVRMSWRSPAMAGVAMHISSRGVLVQQLVFGAGGEDAGVTIFAQREDLSVRPHGDEVNAVLPPGRMRCLS